MECRGAVTRSGGWVAMANWTPGSFIGEALGTVGAGECPEVLACVT
jgi:hypothetical protein